MIRFWKRLHEKLGSEQIALKGDIQTRYRSFLHILTENEHALDLMTELETKYYNRQLISIPYLKGMIKNLSQSIKNIILDLNVLSEKEHKQLLYTFETLEKEVRGIITGSREPIYTPIIIPLKQISKKYIDKVGSKMANLGEIKNFCHLRTPEGFGLTACAYTYFSEYNNLPEKISEILSQVEASNSQSLMTAEKEIKALVQASEVPPEIAQSILQESAKLEKQLNGQILWSVRSSAIGEDLEHSFAGQFSSILNVPTTKLLEKYKAVVASKYNIRSVLYQRMKSIRPEDVNMSVGFLEMVDPICSGVIYTTDPVHTEREEMVISAVWGLGQLLVEGVVSADSYLVKRCPGFPVIRQEIVKKEIMLKIMPEGGTEHDLVPPKLCKQPCLTTEQINRLAQASLLIEKHFQQPQDIEWAFDKQGNLFILQTRPLHLTKTQSGSSTKIKAPIISDAGQSVAAGIGAGQVFKPKDIHDLFNFPKGGVLVLKHSSPQYIGALQKAAAVIVEKGNLTDHMSSVVREFKVPCVVRVPNIFSRLKNKDLVTVDASRGIIYQGLVQELSSKDNTFFEPVTVNITDTESHRILKQLSTLIFPLHLTDPRTQKFKEEACTTWHDIIRFCHEAALNEMFALRENTPLEHIKNIYQLKTSLPLNIYILDLFEDAVQQTEKKLIQPTAVNSLPFKVLWTGMTLPGLPWKGPQTGRPDMAGIMSAMLNVPALENVHYDTRSFAVVTQKYLNLSLSLGYHYVVLDSYLSDDPYLNHITISFKGGAADLRKRKLRVKLVNDILSEAGFKTDYKQDFLKARIKTEEATTMKRCLFTVGALLGMTRLLDLSLENDAHVREYKKKFYSLLDPETLTC